MPLFWAAKSQPLQILFMQHNSKTEWLPMGMLAAVFDEETGIAVLELDDVASVLAAVGARFAVILGNGYAAHDNKKLSLELEETIGTEGASGRRVRKLRVDRLEPAKRQRRQASGLLPFGLLLSSPPAECPVPATDATDRTGGQVKSVKSLDKQVRRGLRTLLIAGGTDGIGLSLLALELKRAQYSKVFVLGRDFRKEVALLGLICATFSPVCSLPGSARYLLLIMMSCVPVAKNDGELCANCGTHGSDIVKLKDCTACRLVKYCGVDCQRAHRKQHKKACKQRVAELKDEQLYSQGLVRPERDFCPICSLPIPIPTGEHSVFHVCCMKRSCNGCVVASKKRGMDDCAFCRTRYPDNAADALAMIQARVAKNDPVAINHLGEKFHVGLGLKKDVRKAIKLWTEAAELGSVRALFNLGKGYGTGDGFQQDKAKAVEFYKKAAMQGHVESRHNLGCIEAEKGNYSRAVKHLLISAKMGFNESLQAIKQLFMRGQATKAQYAEALKGYQDAVDETRVMTGMKPRDLESR
ncbi:hypothetical protein THAOC_03855, partial [Thalassiosira oceanica]